MDHPNEGRIGVWHPGVLRPHVDGHIECPYPAKDFLVLERGRARPSLEKSGLELGQLVRSLSWRFGPRWQVGARVQDPSIESGSRLLLASAHRLLLCPRALLARRLARGFAIEVPAEGYPRWPEQGRSSRKDSRQARHGDNRVTTDLDGTGRTGPEPLHRSMPGYAWNRLRRTPADLLAATIVRVSAVRVHPPASARYLSAGKRICPVRPSKRAMRAAPQGRQLKSLLDLPEAIPGRIPPAVEPSVMGPYGFVVVDTVIDERVGTFIHPTCEMDLLGHEAATSKHDSVQDNTIFIKRSRNCSGAVEPEICFCGLSSAVKPRRVDDAGQGPVRRPRGPRIPRPLALIRQRHAADLAPVRHHEPYCAACGQGKIGAGEMKFQRIASSLDSDVRWIPRKRDYGLAERLFAGRIGVPVPLLLPCRR
ncbi:MAG: hypothetical protein QOG09_812 [Solirubrobacterales bacterium]|nr:hypothetical protein [Solirubrobacterales bacterium]